MNNKELFEKINEILLKSLKPSEDLERLIIEGYLDKEPFNKIFLLFIYLTALQTNHHFYFFTTIIYLLLPSFNIL